MNFSKNKKLITIMADPDASQLTDQCSNLAL